MIGVVLDVGEQWQRVLGLVTTRERSNTFERAAGDSETANRCSGRLHDDAAASMWS